MNNIPVFLPDLDNEAITQVKETLEIGWLGLGSKTKEFEEEISNFLELQNKFVLSTNTATSAIHLGLRIADVGIGDEVITPSFNCVADQHAIKMTGADVVMCDIEEETLGIDCTKLKKLINKKTKAIIPLHYSGVPCNIKEVYEIAEKYELRVVEDCCHAFGTKFENKKLGNFGDMAVFSFDPIKTITSIDGGCLICNNETELDKLQQMRLLGMNNDTHERYKNKRLWQNYDVVSEGYRYHLNNVLASIGLSQLKRIDEIMKTRQDVCKQYDLAFKKLKSLKVVETNYDDISPFIYVIRVLNGNRAKLIEHLKNLKIDTGIHWTPVHRFSYFSDCKKGDMTITEKIEEEILTIPLHANMKKEYTQRVIDGILSFFKKN